MGKKDAHHGGAWKVAYADFVTAMMALFIVLWILTPDPTETRKVIYDDEVPIEGAPGGMVETPGLKTSQTQAVDEADQRKMLEKIGDELVHMMKSEEVEPKPVEVTVLNGILRVTLFDRTTQPMFERGSAKLTAWGESTLEKLALIVKRYNMHFFIDGHTARGASPGDRVKYGPWELSTERAHASRRKFLQLGTESNRIVRVNAYADSRPLEGSDPRSPENQRMSVQLAILPKAGQGQLNRD
jgi:chemotaxis protein MotB